MKIGNFFIKEPKRLYHLFYPYFGISKDNLPRTLALVGIIFCNIFSAFTVVYIQEAFSTFHLMIMQQATLGVLFTGVAGCLIPIVIIASLFSFSYAMASWLADDLSQELSKSLISRWIDNQSYYGIKFTTHKGKKINPAIVIGEDLSEVCKYSISLGSSWIQSVFDFLVGIYQLWIYSSPIIVNCLSLTFALPGYMVIAALIYSIGYSMVVNYLDRNLNAYDRKLKEEKDILNAELHHVNENAESISLKMGGIREKNNLIKSLQLASNAQVLKRINSSMIEFAKSIGNNVSYIFGLVVSIPKIISGTMEATLAFSLAQYFTSVVKFFSWKKDNTTNIVSLNVSLDRFESFTHLLKEWEKLQEVDVTTRIERNHLGVKNLSVMNPSGNIILKNLTFGLPIGKATVIQGPSGVGKTTLFRCLARLWPYVKGEIILPATKQRSKEMKIYYIPQQTYFPYRGTLLDAIIYPNSDVNTKKERKKIIHLMKAFGFNQDKINNIDKRDEWHKKLSGGEQQRIALIGAILKNPDVLLIDEGMNGLDRKMRNIAEKLLKKHLKDTTIVAIDHHFSSNNKQYKPFFDYQLEIEEPHEQSNTKVTLHKFKTR